MRDTEDAALLLGRVSHAETAAQAKALSWKQAKGGKETELWYADPGRVEEGEARFRIFFWR